MNASRSTIAASAFLRAALTSGQTAFVEGLVYKSFFSLVPDITVDEATDAMRFLLTRGFLEKDGLAYRLSERTIDLLRMESEVNAQ